MRKKVELQGAIIYLGLALLALGLSSLQDTFVKVLIIDDSEPQRELISQFLRDHFKLSAITAASGNAAIKILKSKIPFDLIISDYEMPDGSGAEVFAFVKDKGVKIPFILLTAFERVNLEEFQGDAFLGVVEKHDILNLKQKICDAMPAIKPSASQAVSRSSRRKK